MVDLILKDSETNETLALLRTSAATLKATELGTTFSISEIHGLQEVDLTSQMRKEVSYALDKGRIYTLSILKQLAIAHSLGLSMKSDKGVETVIV